MIGVILLNFGEPAEASLEAIVPFLERIFLANGALEGSAPPAAVRARCREMAERRAPGLLAEYQAIGGSPLNAQSEAQAVALAAELARRGRAGRVYVANQFADPLMGPVLRRAQSEGVQRLIALPVYPVCGPSTNVAALAQLRDALLAVEWDVPVVEISGWHRHPEYVRMRADGVVAAAAGAGLDLQRPDCCLVFSAHGTPRRYIDEGSRYVEYTLEACAAIAQAAGAPRYVVGYQNHGNRPIEWTQPSIDRVIADLDATAILVVPVSFMHEQSETLSELDMELRGEAEELGLEFHRVPVPHDDPRFAGILADLVESALAGGRGDAVRLGHCRCRPEQQTLCTNA